MRRPGGDRVGHAALAAGDPQVAALDRCPRRAASPSLRAGISGAIARAVTPVRARGAAAAASAAGSATTPGTVRCSSLTSVARDRPRSAGPPGSPRPRSRVGARGQPGDVDVLELALGAVAVARAAREPHPHDRGVRVVESLAPGARPASHGTSSSPVRRSRTSRTCRSRPCRTPGPPRRARAASTARRRRSASARASSPRRRRSARPSRCGSRSVGRRLARRRRRLRLAAGPDLLPDLIRPSGEVERVARFWITASKRYSNRPGCSYAST